MRYRITTRNLNGEERTIEYNSRKAAYHHFLGMANSRYTAEITLTHRGEDGDWHDEAFMELTRQAQGEPQAEDGRPNG